MEKQEPQDQDLQHQKDNQQLLQHKQQYKQQLLQHKQQLLQHKQQYNQQLQKYKQKYNQELRQHKQQYNQQLLQHKQQYNQQLLQHKQQYNQELRQHEQQYNQKLQQYNEQLQQYKQQYNQELQQYNQDLLPADREKMVRPSPISRKLQVTRAQYLVQYHRKIRALERQKSKEIARWLDAKISLEKQLHGIIMESQEPEMVTVPSDHVMPINGKKRARAAGAGKCQRNRRGRL